eukprot:356735-Chlamydomonas_euryale.AAC.9
MWVQRGSQILQRAAAAARQADASAASCLLNADEIAFGEVVCAGAAPSDPQQLPGSHAGPGGLYTPALGAPTIAKQLYQQQCFGQLRVGSFGGSAAVPVGLGTYMGGVACMHGEMHGVAAHGVAAHGVATHGALHAAPHGIASNGAAYWASGHAHARSFSTAAGGGVGGGSGGQDGGPMQMTLQEAVVILADAAVAKVEAGDLEAAIMLLQEGIKEFEPRFPNRCGRAGV